MVTKISKLESGMFQVNGSEIPIDEESVRGLVEACGSCADKLLEDLNTKGEATLEVVANRGTVVNIYEVEYPAPQDPNKETQDMAKHLDEYNDFITQNLFPGVSAEDVMVQIKSEDEKKKHMPAPVAPAVDRVSTKKNWREVLAWQEVDKEEDAEFIDTPLRSKYNAQATADKVNYALNKRWHWDALLRGADTILADLESTKTELQDRIYTIGDLIPLFQEIVSSWSNE